MALKAHFEYAAELPDDGRERYVRGLERDDPSMAAMLRDLIASGGQGFTPDPPWKAAAVRAFSTGEVLSDRFVIEGFLGAGGAGEVYRAFDRHRKISIALKTIRPITVSDATIPDLRNELNTASLISHSNVCRLHDIVVTPGAASFITMELLAGESLADRIRKGPLSSEEAFPIVLQLINGLAAAHECGIVHRDLKPANIFLVPAPAGVRAVITDFGLAKQIRPGEDITITLATSIAGTPAYMAPEQLEGKPATRAFDIHALGAVMFEMVTGNQPFPGETPITIAAGRLHGEAPSPRRFVPALDRRWENAILVCLARDPANRPASVFDILSLLTVNPVSKWRRRALIAAALAGCAAGGWFVFRPVEHNPEAVAAYHRGVTFNQRRTNEGIEHAIVEFRRTTRLEPRFPEAWSGLADALLAATNMEIMDSGSGLKAARDSATQAVQLNDRLARAHGSLAQTFALDLDQWPRAEAEFHRAVQLDGTDAEVRRWFANYLRKLGRFREAESEARAALELTHSTNPRMMSELVYILYVARQKAQFQTQAKEAHTLFPNDNMIESFHARSLEMDGQFDQAEEVLRYTERLGMNPVSVRVLEAGVAVTRRDFNRARHLASQVEQAWRIKPVDGLLLAGVYARLGENDKAFAILEEALRHRDNTLLSLATSPWVDNLRSDPRFAQWLLRLHFTPQIMQRMELRLDSSGSAVTQPRRSGTS